MPNLDQKMQNQPQKGKKINLEVPGSAKTDMKRALDDLNERNRTLNSNQIIQKNQLEQVRARLVKSLFGILEEMGVDPNNLDSIRSFLTTLEEKDPDLAEMFQIGFNGLVGENNQVTAAPPVNVGTTVTEQNNAGLMDKYKNLAGQVMMPR